MKALEVKSLELRPRGIRESCPPLRVALIGLGNVVQTRLIPAYRFGGVNLVGGADPSEEARARSEHAGIGETFADYRELLEGVSPDVVVVNLRWDLGMTDVRVEVVREVAAYGAHIVMAKPLGATWAACQAMVDAAESCGVVFAVDHNTRFAPAFHACHSLIRAGALGRVAHAGIAWSSPRGRQLDPGFDVVHDMSVHSVDILLNWLDALPRRVYGVHTKTGAGSVLQGVLEFDGGLSAAIDDDYLSCHDHRWTFRVAGDCASLSGCEDIEIPNEPRMARSTLVFGARDAPGFATRVPLAYGTIPGSFLASLADVLHAVADERQPWANGQNALRTMRVLFAVEHSIRCGNPVDLASFSPSTEDL